MSENNESTTSRRTTEDLRQVWNDMFHEVTLSSCKIEKSDHLLKVSMLLKTLFNTHRSLVSELARQEEDRRKQKAITEQIVKEKDETIQSLMEQLMRLKETQFTAEGFQRVLPCVDVELPVSACGDVTMMSKQVAPSLSVKRLSEGEADDLNICFESSTKKVKVDLAPSTPTKEIMPEILVPETLECDYEETYRVPSNLFIPETVGDVFQDLNHSVLVDFEKSPSKAQPSPATPKSPIIRTSKFKKSQDEENKSPRYRGPQISFPVLTNQRRSPVKAKTLNSGSPVSTSPRLPTPKKVESDLFLLPSPANSRFKSSNPGDIQGILSLSKSKSDKVLSPRRENVSSKEKQVSTNSKQNKKQASAPSSYVGGKLEVLPPDKTKKGSKLKQTKLSLSMFQNRRAQSETSALDENEQLQRAIEESVKLANQEAEEEKILFSPSPDRVKPVEKSLVNVNQSMDPDRTYFEPSESVNTFFKEFPELGVGLLDCPAKTSDRTKSSNPMQKKMDTVDEEYLHGYDRGFKKKNDGPGYAYKAPVVRKKDERKQLQGWECHECKQFLGVLCKNMTDEERKSMVNKCSKHRQALPYLANTPPGIWEVAALQTPEEETQAYELIPRRLIPGSRLIDKAIVITESCESNLSI